MVEGCSFVCGLYCCNVFFRVRQGLSLQNLIDIDRKENKMAKEPKNHGKPWTAQQVNQLEKLAKQNTPTRVIGLKIGRTEDSVRSKAGDENISLKPTNQSPYNRRKS